MSVTPPENYVYGTVVGRFLATVADTADDDRFPDVIPATGTVKFTPSVPYYKNTALPATFVTVEQTGNLDAAGNLVDHLGNPGVVLMATDHPDLSPSGWTYKVTMTVNGKQLPGFDISVPSGGTVDLTTVMPALASGGTVTIVTESSRIAAEAARDEALAAEGRINNALEPLEQSYTTLAQNMDNLGGRVLELEANGGGGGDAHPVLILPAGSEVPVGTDPNTVVYIAE